MRSPEESTSTKLMLDLFPFVKARLTELKFRPPRYDSATLNPEVLRREMLRVVFGWDEDIEGLIRDERMYPQNCASTATDHRYRTSS